MKALILAGLLLAADQPIPNKMRACEPQPMNKTEWWSWRLIDGRKCWFIGHSMDKKYLYWNKPNERNGNPSPDHTPQRDSNSDTEPPTKITDSEFRQHWKMNQWWLNKQPIVEWRVWE